MVTGNLSRYLQKKNLKDELCPEGDLEEGDWQDGGVAAATRCEAGAIEKTR